MCTAVRFIDGEDNMFFGRNLDWSFSYGEKVLYTPKDYNYQPAFNAEDRNHAVLGVGIIADDTPLYFDCANDAGLAVAGLNFPGYAEYAPDSVNLTTNVAAYEFPLWVARNFTSVDDVEEALKNVTIVAKPINDQYPVSMLHWIIGDATRSIVVEYMADGMHVYHDDIDALTNQPQFPYHMQNLINYINVDPKLIESVKWGNADLKAWGAGLSAHGLPGDPNSTSRFVRVSYTNAHYPQQKGEQDNVTRLFKTLSSAAMVDGNSMMSNGQYEKTIFTSGFSANTMTYYKNTYDDPTIRAYAMADFDETSNQLQTK
ncbi:choloylglycine hydrolase [Bifidobacterium pseudolongum subsp. globosum]|uniref:choloylglycine hydrolase n=1 Tax=Bifidobacterium pseudolongum TaxID=1694 RepID=UPI001021DDAA|nr:choloylglycine hydrolase [Bifidobacterium pseudolongum]RYQ00723.1 choloylglycine hydrolase [Bifidobacterium pseudolongum subsp. globosum]